MTKKKIKIKTLTSITFCGNWWFDQRFSFVAWNYFLNFIKSIISNLEKSYSNLFISFFFFFFTKPIIIIVDGIDKMDKAERESEALSWLPREYPKNIRLILSTTINSVTHKRIQEREWTNFLTINPVYFILFLFFFFFFLFFSKLY